MARIVLSTFGSAGDLNPFIALAIGLRARGHEAVFCVEENFRPTVQGAGFEVRHLSGDSVAALAPHAERVFGANAPLNSLRALLDYYILPTLPDKIRDLRAACDGADLLVSAAAQLAASTVVDLTGIPWASIALTPLTLPSDEIEAQPAPFELPPMLRRLNTHITWALGGVFFRRMVDRPVNAIRASFGLAPRRDLFWWGNLSPRLTAVAVSPAFQPQPADWPVYVRTTGFLYWDTPSDWQPAPALEDFLDGTRPVVTVTAGSIAPAVAESFASFYRTSIEAIRRVGARSLLIGALPDEVAEPGATDVMALPFAPYSYVFPRSRAIIHHGGAGTTAQALRYGVPALVVPWGFDQYYAGRRVQDIGAGRLILRKRFTAEHASRALDELLKGSHIAAKTAAIRDKIAHEDGVATLCDALEDVLADASRLPASR